MAAKTRSALYTRYCYMKRLMPKNTAKHWPSFESFVACIGEPPSENHRLARINTKEPFSPTNLCWKLGVKQAYKTNSEESILPITNNTDNVYLHEANTPTKRTTVKPNGRGRMVTIPKSQDITNTTISIGDTVFMKTTGMAVRISDIYARTAPISYKVITEEGDAEIIGREEFKTRFDVENPVGNTSTTKPTVLQISHRPFSDKSVVDRIVLQASPEALLEAITRHEEQIEMHTKRLADLMEAKTILGY